MTAVAGHCMMMAQCSLVKAIDYRQGVPENRVDLRKSQDVTFYLTRIKSKLCESSRAGSNFW